MRRLAYDEYEEGRPLHACDHGAREQPCQYSCKERPYLAQDHYLPGFGTRGTRAHGACSKNNQKVRYMPCTCVHTHCYRRVQAIPRTAAQKTTAHRATRTAHRAPGRLRVKLVQQITLAPIQRPVHVRTEWAWAKRRNKSIADGISACPWQRLAAWQQWPPVPAPLLWLRCCFYLNRC